MVGSAKPLPFGHGFRWNKVLMKCPKGKSTISGHFNFPMNVGPGGRFKKSVSTSTGKTTVSGTFSSASKASGKLKFNGGVYHEGELWTGCVTNAKWSASTEGEAERAHRRSESARASRPRLGKRW